MHAVSLSITGAVFGTVPPPLVDFEAVKLRLAQLGVDLVVLPAQPLGEPPPTRHHRRLLLDLGPKVSGAVVARVKAAERPDKLGQVRLLVLGQLPLRQVD